MSTDRTGAPLAARLQRGSRQAAHAIEILRRDGAASLGRKALRIANTRFGSATDEFPIPLEDIADPGRLTLVAAPEPVSRDRPFTVGWLTSPPSIGSGGHTTMFRMVEALENAGHTCRIVLYDRFGGNVDRHRSTIREGWPTVRAEVQDVSQGFAGLDACVATAWQTAHVLALRCDVALQRLFFVQDYEPYFYAHGSEYTLAVDAYRFGFSCITIGRAVAHVLHEKHGIDADWVDFGCDTDVYRLTEAGPRNGVVMYAKPTVPRRGYLHNVAALRLFHERHPEQQIHIFGQPTGDLPFPATVYGTVSPAELNRLYNRTHTGLAPSFTNMTLVAEEMLAAGNIPVINDTDIGRRGLDNSHVIWAESTPGALADALSSVVEHPERDERARAAAASVIDHTWTSSQGEFVAAVEKKVYGPST